jgi:hypothetical protein
MKRLRLWLSVHDIEVLEETSAAGRVLFNLRLPSGATLPAVFGEEALEDNPDKAISYLELIIEKLAV